MAEGVKIITTTHVEKWNAVGSATDAVPWPTIFTGIMVVHFFYWTTNQAIVQRALGARDLKAGQKGILIAALFLLLLPLILNLPGLLSFHILGEGLKPIDVSYPELVNKTFPTVLQGFFIAALFGAILSTFNSFLNSAATIYCKDLLPSISKKQFTDAELISYAKKSLCGNGGDYDDLWAVTDVRHRRYFLADQTFRRFCEHSDCGTVCHRLIQQNRLRQSRTHCLTRTRYSLLLHRLGV